MKIVSSRGIEKNFLHFEREFFLSLSFFLSHISANIVYDLELLVCNLLIIL